MKFSDVGARVQIPVSERVGFHASLGWRHAFGRVRSEARLAFADGGDSFLSTGTSLSRDAASPTLDIVWAPLANMRLSAGYVGLYGAANKATGGRLTLGITL